jgi:adhesin transport system outer membrane protein
VKKLVLIFILFSTNLLALDREIEIIRIIETTLDNNPSVLVNKYEYFAKQKLEDSAYWSYFPIVSASIEFDDDHKLTKLFRVEQSLYSGGKIDAEYKKAKLSKVSASLSIDEIKQKVSLGIVESINNILMYHGRVLIYNDYLDRLERYNTLIDKRIASGISPNNNIYLIKSKIYQAITDKKLAEIGRKKAFFALQQLTNSSLNVKDISNILQKEICNIKFDKKYENSRFIEDVLDNSPSLKKLSNDIKVAQEEVKIKKSDLLPKVYLRADKTIDDYDSSRDDNRLYIIGEYKFGGNLNLHNIEAAKYSLLAAKSTKEAYELELKKEVLTEFSHYNLIAVQYKEYENKLFSSEQILKSYKRLYNAGKKSWQDLLNADKEMTSSQLALSDLQVYLELMPLKLKIYTNKIK